MKPKQISMIEELSKCCMTRIDKECIAELKTRTEWDAMHNINTPLAEWASNTLFYIWNKYQMQIRHIRRAQKRGK